MLHRAIAGLLCAAAVLGMLATPAAAQPSTTSVIVVVARGADVSALAATVAAEHGGHVGHVYEHVLGGFELEVPTNAFTAIEQSPGVLAVVPNDTFTLGDVAGYGFFRIAADQSVTDAQGPYRGAATRVATIDSGIDTNHPDLAPHLDLAHSKNCVGPGTPEDDNGHGTHVAGIAAAAFNNDGFGIVGVAPEASIVAFKAFDANGYGSTANIVCALDALAQVTTAAPMPTALNMSFGDVGTDSTCDDGNVTDVVHEALCDVVSAGTAVGVPVIPIAAAGNEDVDAANTIPAAFHDVITVSALADNDGAPGGLAGCQYITMEFNWECDDTIASFSNWGSVVDVAAPGVDIYSDYPDNDFAYLSGTSMAAPHVTGVVAAMLGANASLDTAAARALLQQTGECPDGTEAGADTSCTSQGQWRQTSSHSIFDPQGTEPDPDGIAEPLVNAARASRAADASGNPPPSDAFPSVAITSPSNSATVGGTVTVSGTSADDHGVTNVALVVDGATAGTTTPAADGTWSVPWDTTAATNGSHSLVARATDSVGHQTDSATVTVTVQNGTASTVMHVSELLGSAVAGRKWTANATIRIVDANGVPVSGATVTVSVGAGTASVTAKGGNGPGGPGGGSSGALSCVTASDGRCSVSYKPTTASVRFTVTGVTKTGFTYDSAANVDGDTSTPATDIVVLKP